MPVDSPNTRIILASQSKFRAELLARLQLDFEQIAPNIDESRQDGESLKALVTRLAKEKAHAVQEGNPDAIIIASDQIAVFGNEALGKPRTRERAISQLSEFSGNKVIFYTAVAVQQGTKISTHLDKTRVYFKELTQVQIENYIDNEDVLNCAGSFKSEGLGISLFKKIKNNDPTALIGLPMIWLADCLQNLNVSIPKK